jgi:hypothetical protein
MIPNLAQMREHMLRFGVPVKNPPRFGVDSADKRYFPVPKDSLPQNPEWAMKYAKEMVSQRGWTDKDYEALMDLWGNKESGWDYKAVNASSGAAGIPQAHPKFHEAPNHPNFIQNPKWQVDWGLDYIQERYGSPSNALAFWQKNKREKGKGWY